MATSGSSVDHPSHYQTDSGLEAIDVIEAFFPESFHLGNAFKYLASAGKKGDLVEDLEKAIWYIEQFIDTQVRYTLTDKAKALQELEEKAYIQADPSDEIEFTDQHDRTWLLKDDGFWYVQNHYFPYSCPTSTILGWTGAFLITPKEGSGPKPGVTYSAEEVDQLRDYRFMDDDGDEWWFEDGVWSYRSGESEDSTSALKPYECSEPYRLKEEND